MVVPHCDSGRPWGVAPTGYEGAAPLHESYTKSPSFPEGDEFIMMVYRFACKYNTHDIVEEYRSIPVCLLLDGWAVADDAWAADIGGIPCPNWMKVFSFTSAREFFVPFADPCFSCCLSFA
jgi:hypothetical protein